MIPSEADIKKKKQQLESFLKQIDPETGKSDEYKTVLTVRSAIRKTWMRSPTKLAYLASKTLPDMDDSTRTKWKIQCECCGDWFKLNEVEVDHVEGNHTFNKVSDFENYFNKILMVGFDGLQILCKDKCHATKNYMEKNGCTWDEAVIMKETIAICKSKQDKQWLIDREITPKSNQAGRREQIINELKREKTNETH